ncbi:MAG: hypothetical protein PHV13_02470 [Candidatus ainarchaeum sp.]|nr:hypothetical protein [Candidatus ainarchaeum sp.]
MKLTHDTARQEGAPKRPFRKLKAAAGVLVTAAKCVLWVSPLLGLTALVMLYKSGYDGEKKERAEVVAYWDERDSFARAKGWAPISDGADVRSQCIIHRWSKLQDATTAERRLLIRDAVDEYEWKARMDFDLDIQNHHIDSNARREDSLFIVAGMRKEDDAGLAEVAEYLSKPNLHMSARRRDSLISATLNRFKPMLPEARERKSDSLWLHGAAKAGEAATLREDNSKKLKAIVANTLAQGETAAGWKAMIRSALRKYEKVKAPDGCSRESDSITVSRALRWQCTCDVDCYKRWLKPAEPLSEKGFKEKWGNVSGIPRF